MMDDDNSSVVWPDVPRFCFGPSQGRHRDANITWVQGQPDIYPYAEGYRRAAIALMDSMPEHQQNADFLIWPLAFLWRHHIELMLKDIISKGRRLSGEATGFPESHDLATLWRDARQHIVRCGPNDAPELTHLDAAIQEFQSVDPGATGFRYPFAIKQGGRGLPHAPDRINLDAFQTPCRHCPISSMLCAA